MKNNVFFCAFLMNEIDLFFFRPFTLFLSYGAFISSSSPTFLRNGPGACVCATFLSSTFYPFYLFSPFSPSFTSLLFFILFKLFFHPTIHQRLQVGVDFQLLLKVWIWFRLWFCQIQGQLRRVVQVLRNLIFSFVFFSSITSFLVR